MPRINLARPRRSRAGLASVPTSVLAVALLVLSGAAAGVYALHHNLLRQVQAQQHANAGQRAALAAAHTHLAPLQAARARYGRLAPAHTALAALHRDSTARARVLRDLATLHHGGTHYTALRFQGGRLRLSGVAAGAGDLSALLARLGGAPWFRRPGLQTTGGGGSSLSFTLNLVWREEP